MSSPSSFTPLRKQPSSLRSHATSRIHGSGTETETDRWEDPLTSHPLSTSVPSAANLSHPFSSSTSTSTSAQRASMGSPRAHPYQLAGYSNTYRPAQDASNGIHEQPIRPTAAVSKEAPREMREKHRAPNNTLPSNEVGQEELERRRNQRRKTAHRRASLGSLRILNNYPVPSAPKAPRIEKSSIPQIVTFFSTALILPVILPVIYLPTGHAILRLAQQSKEQGIPSIYSLAGIPSSAKAGAVGGAILALPLLLVLYLLGFFPSSVSGVPDASSTPQKHHAGEDFFEDSDTDSMKWTSARLARYASIALVSLLVLSIGGMTGPLGATALSSSSGDPVRDAMLRQVEVFLTPGPAAVAGMVGGCIVAGGSLVMILLSAGMMMLFASVDNQQLEVPP
jgi:hypothetical protein